MTRTSAAVLALLLTVGGDGIASAQTTSAGQTPAKNDASGVSGDPAKDAKSAPRAPDTAGTVDVSPGVGAIEGADGKPPLPASTGK